MGIAYRLTAFDRQTEELIGSNVIPKEFVPEIRRIAQIPPADDGAGDYPLDDHQAREIGRLLNVPVTIKTAEYFLEPYVLEMDAEDRAAGK